MTRKPLFWISASVAVMMLLPWLAVTFVQSDAGMTAMLMLFFGIDPLYSLMAGYYAGKQIRRFWWVPALTAGLFLAGVWLCLDTDPAFWTYAGIYFALGMEGMFVSRLITVRRENDG